MLRVTFDTNAFDKVARPYVYTRDPNYGNFAVIHEAIKRRDVLAFISETIITLEGVGTDKRAPVFGTIGLRNQTNRISDDRFEIALTTEQPDRPPIHVKQAERFVAAFDLGMRLLGAPRIGMPKVEGDFYVVESPDDLPRRLDRYFNILQAIEARGLGAQRVWEIARRWADRAPNAPWYRVLGTATDIHEIREVARAVAEWSDADSIGAHHGYGNDVFCTLDVGAGEQKRGDTGILDGGSRQWLASNFGISFASLADLAARIASQ